MYCCSKKRNDSGKVEHTRQHPIGLWQTHFLAEYRVSSAGTFNRHQRKITSLLSVQIESLRSCFIFAILLNPLNSFNTICMILLKTNKFFGASQILRISNGYICFIYIFRETLSVRCVKICNKKINSNLLLHTEQCYVMELICRSGEIWPREGAEHPPTASRVTALTEKPQSATSGTFRLHSAGCRDLTGAVPGCVTRREQGAVGCAPRAAHKHTGLTNPLPDCKCPLTPERRHMLSQS